MRRGSPSLRPAAVPPPSPPPMSLGALARMEIRFLKEFVQIFWTAGRRRRISRTSTSLMYSSLAILPTHATSRKGSVLESALRPLLSGPNVALKRRWRLVLRMLADTIARNVLGRCTTLVARAHTVATVEMFPHAPLHDGRHAPIRETLSRDGL